MTGPQRLTPSSLREALGQQNPGDKPARATKRPAWAGLAASLAGHVLLLALVVTLGMVPAPLEKDVVLMVETVNIVPGDPRAGGTSQPGRKAVGTHEPGQPSDRTRAPAPRPEPAPRRKPPDESTPAKQSPAQRTPKGKPSPGQASEPNRQAESLRRAATRTNNIKVSEPLTPSPDRPKQDEREGQSDTPPNLPDQDEGQEQGAAGATRNAASGPHEGQGAGQERDEGPGRYEGIFGEGEGPRFRQRVTPVYPPQARRLGRQGVVTLRLAIDASGTLTHVEVTQSAGQMLDEAAVRALEASSYRPATRGGRPAPCLALIRIRFSLTS